MHNTLELHLQTKLPLLHGSWVRKNSSYEKELCEILEMTPDRNRYWDAKWHNFFIELKKGRSIWLDLVRYSEIILKESADSCRSSICLFFIPDPPRQKISEIICVETSSIISFLKISPENARLIREISGSVPHSLNVQANLTLKDLRKIQAYSVK